MRYILLIFSFFLVFSCQTKNKEIKRPTWLIGNWKRINDKPNNNTYEFWNNDFTGLGFTLKKNDTVFKEMIRVISKNDSLYFEVVGVNKIPTLFKFTKQTDSSFVCENPKNEFPKKIKYTLDNKLLKAEISDKDFKIDFVFKSVL